MLKHVWRSFSTFFIYLRRWCPSLGQTGFGVPSHFLTVMSRILMTCRNAIIPISDDRKLVLKPPSVFPTKALWKTIAGKPAHWFEGLQWHRCKYDTKSSARSKSSLSRNFLFFLGYGRLLVFYGPPIFFFGTGFHAAGCPGHVCRRRGLLSLSKGHVDKGGFT